jgi:hypothetical protein
MVHLKSGGINPQVSERGKPGSQPISGHRLWFDEMQNPSERMSPVLRVRGQGQCEHRRNGRFVREVVREVVRKACSSEAVLHMHGAGTIG